MVHLFKEQKKKSIRRAGKVVKLVANLANSNNSANDTKTETLQSEKSSVSSSKASSADFRKKKLSFARYDSGFESKESEKLFLQGSLEV